ncbi:MAG: ABC transporter substrate-binding protein [Burkholderiaceae bacterium]
MTTNAIRHALALWACLLLPVPTFAQTGITDDAIRLGMVNAQSGPASGLGQGMLAGAKAVFDAVNLNGGIHGRRIELLVADDGYEPDQAIDQTLAMIEDEQVFALFGYVGTPTANAVLPIVREMQVPLVGLFTGAGTLRSPVTREVFNVRASYDDEAEAMIAHFLSQGAGTVGVFYQDDGFGKAVLSGTRKALTRRGMQVHATGTFTRNTMAVKQGLADLIRAQPDAIVMVGTYAPLAGFIREARANGLTSQLATVSFVGSENLVGALDGAGDGVIISQVVPSPDRKDIAAVNECRDLVHRHSGQALGFVNLEGCLSAKVMLGGLALAGRDLNREKLITALESMKAFDLGNLTIGFSRDDHQAFKQVFLTQIVDGRVIRID